ncbi:hypothetical protein V1504DRAFT_459067 [Lipomyces starkeyi]
MYGGRSTLGQQRYCCETENAEKIPYYSEADQKSQVSTRSGVLETLNDFTAVESEVETNIRCFITILHFPVGELQQSKYETNNG